MDTPAVIDGYLGRGRDDIPALQKIRRTDRSEVFAQERIAMRDQLVAIGPEVIPPMLRAISEKLSKLSPSFLVGEEVVLAVAQCILRNAEEVVNCIGAVGRPSLLSALLDFSPVVRSLAAAFLVFAGTPDKTDVVILEQLFGREQDPAARIAMGGALLCFSGTCSKGSRAMAKQTVTTWAERIEPGWKSQAKRQGFDEERVLTLIVTVGHLESFVYPLAKSQA